jgi:hypothetical protein
MKRWDDVQAMISQPAIDKRTEEKMFFGTLDPEDAPPEFARVAVLLRAAALPRTDAPAGSLITDTDKLRQQHVVAAMAAAIAAAPEPALVPTSGHGFWQAKSGVRPRAARGRARSRARLVLVMALGLMIASAGMAFAGVLPSPVQHAASVLLSKVGVHVPDGGMGQGSENEPGSSSGHEKVTGSGDEGNGQDRGKHTGQEKNGNRGLHKGHGKGHTDEHGPGGQKGNSGEHRNAGQQSGRGQSGEPHGQEGGGNGPRGDHSGNGGNHGHDGDGSPELGSVS